MLVSGIEILNKAHKEGYGVGAFNFVNFEMLNAIFMAANEAKSPIIVQASEGAIKYMGIDMAVGLVKILSNLATRIFLWRCTLTTAQALNRAKRQ